MEEIKEGEYVRTKNGIIDKIYEYREDTKIYHCERKLIIDSENMLGTYIQDITKHSFNIIDLIEEGDYVNGCKVYADDLFGKYIIIWEEESNYYRKIYLTSIVIKTIVTKEQFESMSYKVGD